MDENIVNVALVVQFRRTDPQSFMFNLRNPEATLEAATASAIREVIGRNVLDFILTDGRAEVSQQAQDLLQATLDSYEAGITIYEVNLVNAEFPSEVEVAVQDSIRAREDRERRILEAQTYSNDILPRARGEAERRRQEAEAYREQVVADAEGESDRFTQILAEYQKAPGVTRERMYIETLEEVLRTSTKVLVDTEGGNNLLYLPLDQLVAAPFDALRLPSRRSRRALLRRRPAARRSLARAGYGAVTENLRMNPRMNLLLIVAVLAAIVIRMSVFTVDAREHAVKFRIGRIVQADYEPGLHFKIPFFENVARYPNRVLIYDEDSRERFLTGEKKNLIVDYFVNWRVVDPAQYYRSVSARRRHRGTAFVGDHQGRHPGRDRPPNAPRGRVGGAHRAHGGHARAGAGSGHRARHRSR